MLRPYAETAIPQGLKPRSRLPDLMSELKLRPPAAKTEKHSRKTQQKNTAEKHSRKTQQKNTD
jgi:hypothetical protein